MDSPSSSPPSASINRQYVQRSLYNWRHQLGIEVSVEQHPEFVENKKHYLRVEHLDPTLLCKMIKRFYPDFQFPSNPIPIPPQNNNI